MSSSAMPVSMVMLHPEGFLYGNNGWKCRAKHKLGLSRWQWWQNVVIKVGRTIHNLEILVKV